MLQKICARLCSLASKTCCFNFYHLTLIGLQWKSHGTVADDWAKRSESTQRGCIKLDLPLLVAYSLHGFLNVNWHLITSIST
jgi:hypothetical protein